MVDTTIFEAKGLQFGLLPNLLTIDASLWSWLAWEHIKISIGDYILPNNGNFGVEFGLKYFQKEVSILTVSEQLNIYFFVLDLLGTNISFNV